MAEFSIKSASPFGHIKKLVFTRFQRLQAYTRFHISAPQLGQQTSTLFRSCHTSCSILHEKLQQHILVSIRLQELAKTNRLTSKQHVFCHMLQSCQIISNQTFAVCHTISLSMFQNKCLSKPRWNGFLTWIQEWIDGQTCSALQGRPCRHSCFPVAKFLMSWRKSMHEFPGKDKHVGDPVLDN
jgi:hypothetical protein